MMRLLVQLVVSIFVLVVVCNGCREIKEEHFANLDIARQSHMIEKGWIPAFLPQDAKDISFQGDLDAGSVYGTYSSSDAATLLKHCSNTDDLFRVPGYGPEWFRNILKESDTAGELRHKGYEVFQCEGGFDVVFLRSQQFGYYWSVRN